MCVVFDTINEEEKKRLTDVCRGPLPPPHAHAPDDTNDASEKSVPSLSGVASIDSADES